MADHILTIRQVADLLQINEKTVYKLAADSKIPGFKVGGSWRFDRGTIAKWIEKKSIPEEARGAPHQPAPFNGAAVDDRDEGVSAATYSPQQGSFFAHRITLEGTGEETLAQSLTAAR